MHIVDRKGAENPVADNLSRLENVLDDPLPIDDSFPDEQLAIINASRTAPWHAVGGNDTYGINGIPTTVGGRGVVRRAGLRASTKVVYPGSGRGDRVIP